MRERLRLLRSDRGATSLIEISITLLLLGVVMSVFMSVVVSLQTASARQEARVARNDDVRLALAQLDREIRSGNVLFDPALESDVAGDVVGGMSLRVYTQADYPNRSPGNQCGQWRITNGTLQTRRWASTLTGVIVAGTVTSWWTVASNIVNRTVAPQVTAFTLDTTPSYNNGLIKIRLVVDRNDDAGQPQEADLSITARNTVYGGFTRQLCSTVPAY